MFPNSNFVTIFFQKGVPFQRSGKNYWVINFSWQCTAESTKKYNKSGKSSFKRIFFSVILVRTGSGDIKVFSNSDHTSLAEVLIEKVESWYPP